MLGAWEEQSLSEREIHRGASNPSPGSQTDSEVDLIAELERLAATEAERFQALERSQLRSAEQVRARLRQLNRDEPSRRMAALCDGVLRERFALVDVDYLRARSAEILARDEALHPEVDWEGDFPCDLDWVIERAHEALSDILLEDEEHFSDGGESRLDEDFHHHCLVYRYGVEPRAALAASVRFHRLADETRRGFFALIENRWSVERCVAMGLGPRFRLLFEVRSALKALLFLEDLWPAIPTLEREGEGDHYDEI
jgi:hypothetical protein